MILVVKPAFCNTFDLHEATICHKGLCVFSIFEWLFYTGFTALIAYAQKARLNTHADIPSRARGLHLHPCLCIAAKAHGSLCICAGLPEPLLLDSIRTLVKGDSNPNGKYI